MDETECYRCRLFYLKHNTDPTKQAEAACEVLAGTKGVILAAPASENSIHLIYSLNHLSFELLTDLLAELDFELDDSILLSLRKTIFQYLEDNARDNMHIDVSEFQQHCESPPHIPHQNADRYWEDYH
ncbi:MAG: hypothetical protein OEY09_00305 [Gammaproteobacteria bacterium]|nr:hypothetical protein [Gammaproteobacteria bacterium]